MTWKVAEVAITAIAFLGFWMGRGPWETAGPWVVLATVFLMGTHSAFFVPAKYGVMPEILPAAQLSRGNGILESLSFLAVILGTVSGGVLSYLFLGREWVIGAILFVLAVVGALASLLIRRVPPANPGRAFPAYVYGPLVKNLRPLLAARSAAVGPSANARAASNAASYTSSPSGTTLSTRPMRSASSAFTNRPV